MTARSPYRPMGAWRGRPMGTWRRSVSRCRPGSTGAGRVGTVGVGVLLVLAWVRVTGPQLVDVLHDGRPAFNSPVESMPATGRLLGDAVTAAFLGLAVLLTGYGLWRRRPDRLPALALVLAPLATIHLAGLIAGERPGPVALALPAAAVASWVLRPGPSVLATIGALGAVTAAGSILLAALRPDLALLTGADAGAKSGAIGGLLTGPYPHSNVLGLILALSLPFVFGLRHPPTRRVALTSILVALLWTGSRTSQLAALVVLLSWALLSWGVLPRGLLTRGRRGLLIGEHGRPRGLLIGVPVAAGLGLTVASPLLTTDPASFTERGRIWRALLSRWAERPFTGHGPGYFERQPGLAEALGGRYTHGHNLLVHLLTVGGLLTVALFAVLLGLVWRRATILAGAGAGAMAGAGAITGPPRSGSPAVVPVLFLVALAWVSWLEASHAAVTLAGHLTWLPLCLIARAGPPDPPDPGPPSGSEDQDVA
ncbi:O-antigen ligase family protein [Micromonospora sp. DT233]|uniref:O-antigen ligase family protein n=1 Tax=Micromonospora sp. DT233 TaxID=3393432 RepID=UPI003CEA3E64